MNEINRKKEWLAKATPAQILQVIDDAVKCIIYGTPETKKSSQENYELAKAELLKRL